MLVRGDTDQAHDHAKRREQQRQPPEQEGLSSFIISGPVPMTSAAVTGLHVFLPRNRVAVKPATPMVPSDTKATR
jgi:hypothetical protein